MFNGRNLNICLVVLAYLAISSIHTAVADTHSVSSGQSIQAAIDASVHGDQIEVAPGTYLEAINFNGKAVRLYSSGGPDVSTIDATGTGASVVTCSNGEGSGTILEGFTITGGNATNGGGMFNTGSSPTVTNCTFASNRAWRGGGMLNDENSNPTVTDCVFTSNTGDYGGGMYNAYGSNSIVTNCTFKNNNAPWFGGGMENDWVSSPTVTNCRFTSNYGYYGGGMFNGSSGNATVTNCTFINNSSPYGGGIYSMSNSCTVTNCILWDNGSAIVASASTPTVTYSDVQNGTGESWFGTGCIDTDPMFADADGRLSPASPCIDAGDNSVVVVMTDLDGNPRIQGLCVDMGAFEAAADPELMLDMLELFITAEVNGGNIDPEIETSLLAKVNAAISALERDNPNDAKVAMNDLKALVNQVEAQTDNKITAETAASIIGMANQIITVLGG